MTLSLEDKKSVDFVNFLISESWSNKWNEMGARQVNAQEQLSMLLDKGWKTDEEVSIARYSSSFWDNDDVIFGAEDYHVK